MKTFDKQKRVTHQEEYITFLQKAVDSENFKKNDPEGWVKSKEKLKREKLILRMVK